MQYSQLQAQVAARLDNRNGLAQVIYDYSQSRIQYWSSFFFYNSDIVDTSLYTTPGQVFYNLPAGIRYLRRLRLLIGSQLNNAQLPQTTLSAPVTLPAATIPVASTSGFSATLGVISVGGAAVFYNTTDATDFTQCVGVAPNGVQGVYAAGTPVIQLAGVWLDMTKRSYDYILAEDVLSPSIRSLPQEYAQINTQLRLFPIAAATYPLECTGNGAPPPPTQDTDDNYWTEDAAWLIIADTTNEIRRGYLHQEDRQADVDLVKRERNRLMKLTWDLADNTQLRSYI